MKKVFLFALLTIFAFTIIGCGGESKPKQTPELKALAEKENAWLSQLQPIAVDIKTTYAQWESGQINRTQLAEKLSKHNIQIKAIRDQYDRYITQNKLSDEVKKNPDYDKGLYYGGSLRLNVATFLQEVVKGYPNAPSDALKKATPVTDDKLKEFYRTEMKEGYERKLGLLQSAIDKYKQQQKHPHTWVLSFIKIALPGQRKLF